MALSVKVKVPLWFPVEEGEKVTLTVHFAPAAKEVQVEMSLYGPEVWTPVKVTVVLPEFVTVTSCEALEVPAVTLPKFRLVGEMLMVAPEPPPPPLDDTPLPESGMVCGLLEASSAMVTSPVKVPVVVGAKSTLIVQLPPAETEVPHVPCPAKAKGPEIVKPPLKFKVALPVFVSVTNCTVLVVPTV